MIDLDAPHDVGNPVQVDPSDQLFSELGNNTYDYKDLLSELIDNSLAARRKDELLRVKVTVAISQSDPTRNWLTVFDDASGIREDRLGLAISPAGIQSTDSLNEHGLGMKQAVAGMGRLKYLATKVDGEKHARVIQEFQFGSIYPKLVTVPWDRGTEIAITELKPIVRTHPVSYGRDLIPYLGARYRRFLTPSNPRAQIVVELVDVDEIDKDGNNTILNHWNVTEVKPIYFHPNKHVNAPVINHRLFKGVGWEAELVFGYSPEGYEWKELGLDEPSKFHPYSVTMSRQGLDVLLNDRVIMFHQLPELGIVGTRHNQYNSIRGEILLKTGFTTAITKNSIVATEHWNQCISEVRKFLEENKLVKSKTYPDALPEAALRDRLANWLKTNDLARKEDVKTEYTVEGLGGKIDVLADGEAWELKRDDANGLDVYQLFAYLDMTDFSKGYLLAKSFKTSAHAACDHINKTHAVEITLTTLDKYPINQPLTESEMAKYL